MGEWISVKDRLPIEESDNFVSYACVDVIAHRDGEVFPAEFSVGRVPKFWGDFSVEGYVKPEKCITHWMPLPDPPEK